MPCMKKHCHALRAFSVVSVEVMYSMTVIISTVMFVYVQSELGFVTKFLWKVFNLFRYCE